MKNKIIIFLSGSFHGPWCWEKFIPYFDQMNSAYKTIVVEYKRKKNSKISDYVDRLEEIIDQNKDDFFKICIISHSLGTVIAQEYIKKNPDRIDKCVFLSPVPPRNAAFQMLKAQIRMGKKSYEEILFSHRIEYADEKKYISLLEEESYKIKIGLMRNIMPKAIQCSTEILIIGSHNDWCMPLSASIKTAEFYRCKLILVKESCHDMMLDPQWKEIATYCWEFIG